MSQAYKTGLTILVVGSGGREHALAWKLAQSPRCARLFVAPGNAGTAAWNVDIRGDDFAGLADLARREGVDLTVVGPEGPLCQGIVDVFQEQGLKIFGPSRQAAQLEGSKVFAKDLMRQAGIPTAAYRVFDNKDEALAYLDQYGAPVVVKADGLAAGKGAIVALTYEEAVRAVEHIMGGGLGEAGKRVVIEECLVGQEVSFFCVCDGQTALPLLAAQDHKRLRDHDEGPNTGGMGAYGPPVFWNEDLEKTIMDSVANPTLEAMADAGAPFVGVLFIGLILTEAGPKVLEYNVRFGDPETQILMMLLASDLVEVLEACVEGALAGKSLCWHPGAALCVVMAAPGYPEKYGKGLPIVLPDLAPDEGMRAIYHAGTAWVQEAGLVSSGGRVLGVTARGESLKEAQRAAYDLVERIGFVSAHYRRDIGAKGFISRP
ncbi:MAG: phosphoribosylamine--glycine ligase [Peptococcaceae bacterium]|nr:phosphoribosylamine--glycine ligase [Peptococcaceae bacterium]